MDLRDGRFSTPTTPSEIVNFDKNTPTTAGVVFDPDMPATTDVLYVSSTNASTWIYQDGGYITYTAPTSSVTTAWTLNGTTIDAGGNKTAAISRTGSITIGADSYFNSIRIGRGGGNSIQNTVVGVNAGLTNTSGLYNVFIGTSSGSSNTTGGGNIFSGWAAGAANTTGTNNTYLGFKSGNASLTTSENTFIGNNSGLFLTTGSSNTFLGNNSATYIQDGSTALTSSTNSVFIGSGARPLANSQTNQIAIGYNTIGKGSNTVNIGNSSITNTYLNGSVTINSAFTLPSTDGAAGYFLKTNGSGTVSWASAAGGLTYFTEAQSTASPNATVNVDSLTAVASTTDADFAILPKGAGAILARVPDNTGTGGNKRGQYALDLSRTAGAGNTYIAGGNYDIILGGTRNSSATGTYSFIANGDFNSCTGQYGTILNGNNNSVTGARGIVLNGWYSQANGANALAGAGLYNYANGSNSVALCNGTTASGNGAMTIGQATTGSGQNSFAGGNGSIADAINGFAIGDLASTNGVRNKFVIGGGGYSVGGTQAAIAQLDGRTTGTTPTVLLANTQNAGGILASTQFTLPNNSLMRVKGSIQGKQSGSTNVGVWDFDAVLVRGATASTIIIAGTPSISLVVNTGGFGNPTITVNTTIGCMTVTVTGLAATNIQWACRIDSCETLYA